MRKDELNGSASVNKSSLIDDTFLYLTEHKDPSQCSSEVQKRAIRSKARRFFVHDGVMYFKKIAKGKVCTCKGLQLVLPGNLVKSVLEGLHSTLVGGHMGAAKTLAKVQELCHMQFTEGTTWEGQSPFGDQYSPEAFTEGCNGYLGTAP